MKTLFASLALITLLSSSPFQAAFAQSTDTGVPGHPRVNEVDQRLQDQQTRIDNGVKDGQMTAGQTTRDETRDARVSQELSKDEAKNNGHITKAEQRRLNRQLNRNSADIHRQRKAVKPTPSGSSSSSTPAQ